MVLLQWTVNQLVGSDAVNEAVKPCINPEPAGHKLGSPSKKIHYQKWLNNLFSAQALLLMMPQIKKLWFALCRSQRDFYKSDNNLCSEVNG